jgi:Protein of unknown function (DUF1360)
LTPSTRAYQPHASGTTTVVAQHDPATGLVETVSDVAQREAAAYSHGEQHPLGGYLGIMGAYVGSVAAGAVIARVLGRSVPGRVSTRDILLTGIATFRLSRLMAKDPVTSPMRAPFTRFEGVSGPGELQEEVRGEGVRHAVGELVTCPFCISHWLATAFGFGFVLAPEVTRFVAAMMSAEAAADFLQFAYSAVEQRVQ